MTPLPSACSLGTGPSPLARDTGALPPSPRRLPRHNVIDNREVTLRDELLKVLPRCKAANFALGYFFLFGYRVFRSRTPPWSNANCSQPWTRPLDVSISNMLLDTFSGHGYSMDRSRTSGVEASGHFVNTSISRGCL